MKRLTPYERSINEAQNKARKLNNLPLIPVRVRVCLKCGEKFESTNKRICCNIPSTHVLSGYEMTHWGSTSWSTIINSSIRVTNKKG